ncbi:MAG TPA: FHA domain-containing protein [Armatimonadota bacterium]|nr:FHA domain-containing protein [Armatimonadota bacterium]HOM81682.1 FHA domain-containing protein [Armatimonadota bacterium]
MNTDEERTIISSTVAQPPAGEATIVFAQDMADRTQMSVSQECPVCHTTNPPGEVYCAECGFLLSGPPPESVEEASAPVACLVASDGREFALNPGRNSIGRANADVLLTDPSISRTHAAITLEEGRCLVEDLGSTNGTRVNGENLVPHQPQALRDGDEIAFGGLSLRVALPEGYAAAPATAAEEASPLAAEPSPARFIDEESGVEYPIPTGTLTIGRRSANDIAFPTDPYVSGRHAQVSFDGETLTLTDIGSTNGTVLNDDRLAPNTPVPLQDGDLVQMGQQRLRVRLAPIPEEEGEVVDEAAEPLAADYPPPGDETPGLW